METAPLPFRSAVEALRATRLRPEIEIESTKPPQRLAPYAYALEAAVVEGDEDLADGRIVLLHDPAGHDAWQGTFRLVTLVRAELEPEMAADPLLPEVCWSWLTGALQSRGLSYGEPSGTVTRASSHYFGGLATRPSRVADRDPGVVDPTRGPGRRSRHRRASRRVVRPARPDRGTSSVGRPRGRGGGDAAAAAGAAVPLRTPQNQGPCAVGRAVLFCARRHAVQNHHFVDTATFGLVST